LLEERDMVGVWVLKFASGKIAPDIEKRCHVRRAKRPSDEAEEKMASR